MSRVAESTVVIETAPIGRRIEGCRRIRRDIERDVIRGRTFDFGKRFLPDGLARTSALGFLNDDEQRLLNQIQGRTYANTFGLVERFVGAKILDIFRGHGLDAQAAREALVCVTDEEFEHQEIFGRIETLLATGMPPGYRFFGRADAVVRAVLAASTWAVLALACHVERLIQVHHRHIQADPELSDLYRDLFLFHWKEKSRHAVLDELEWRREDARLTKTQRDTAVGDLIDLASAVDLILRSQAATDTSYFARVCGRRLSDERHMQVRATLLAAYRWQYIVCAAQSPRFNDARGSLLAPAQGQRIQEALARMMV